MKNHHTALGLLVIVAGLAAGSVSIAHEGKDHRNKTPSSAPKLIAPTDRDAAWLAKAKEAYPLKICLVSEDEFGGDMGEAIDRIYRENGKPDRLVRFCCKSCMDDFKQEPEKYLKIIDAPAKPDSPAMSYVCPMHADVTSAKSGDKCSKCGMTLVPAKPGDAKPHH